MDENQTADILRHPPAGTPGLPKYLPPAPIPLENRQWPSRTITRAPLWASVDLRDGNQALAEPMPPDQKRDYFRLLCDIGFKEIEVGFPAASQDDFAFIRMLIENGEIPPDVRISVLTQAREAQIRRAVEALAGVPRALLHLYLPTSDLHTRFVLGLTESELFDTADRSVALIRQLLDQTGLTGRVGLEFSMEEFSDTPLERSLQLAHRIKSVWGPSDPDQFIINLPATVERRPPNQYADMVEYFIRHYRGIAETTISIHTHNDRGCAVAAGELALLAGATRVEGTLFGSGERTGNLDLMVMALTLLSSGIDPGLDFSHLNELAETAVRHTGEEISLRYPYAGQLAFTAFSGSHQDAIRKALAQRPQISAEFGQLWKIPYLPIDPADIGRSCDPLIRLTSQSGKGGVAYLLDHEYRLVLPSGMEPAVARQVQIATDESGCELTAAQLHTLFMEKFVNISTPWTMTDYSRITASTGDRLGVRFVWHDNGGEHELYGQGNGPLSAVVNALNRSGLLPPFVLTDYHAQSLGTGGDADAMAYIAIRRGDRITYGAGTHSNIDRAAVAALVSALNLAAEKESCSCAL